MPLTPFQRRKLARMFAVYDLDHDGAIRRSDYTRRVEAVARLRGWTHRSPEYERNLKFALMEWEAMCESADIDQDGQVTLDEFLRYGEIFLDDRDAVRSFSRGDAQLLFDAMDVDGDHRISAAEYRAYLDVCGVDPSAADAFFAYADLDEDGKITRVEMSHAVEEFLLSENPEAAGNYLFGPLEPGA